jgi:superfamily II DNA/RNA helicase
MQAAFLCSMSVLQAIIFFPSSTEADKIYWDGDEYGIKIVLLNSASWR